MGSPSSRSLPSPGRLAEVEVLIQQGWGGAEVVRL